MPTAPPAHSSACTASTTGPATPVTAAARPSSGSCSAAGRRTFVPSASRLLTTSLIKRGARSSPSPGTPGEGLGGGLLGQFSRKNPSPLPSPGVPGEGGALDQPSGQ